MRLRRVLSATAAASWILTTAVAARASPSARLVYLRDPGAESCPDESTIRAAVAARLGYDPFFPSAPSTMFAEIARDPKTNVFHARIKLVDENATVRGTRELVHRGDRCEDIVDAIALSMSIAIDPLSLTRPPGAAPSTSPSPSAPVETGAGSGAVAPSAVTPTSTPTPTPAPVEAGAAWHVDAALEGAGWLGVAPSANAGVALALLARKAIVSLSIEGRLDFAASRALADGRVATALAGGTLVPCIHASDRAAGVVPFACVAATAGVLRAGSSDVETPRTDSAFHAAVGPRVGAALWLGDRAAATLHLEGGIALTTHALQLDHQTVYETPRFFAGAAVGVMVRLF